MSTKSFYFLRYQIVVEECKKFMLYLKFDGQEYILVELHSTKSLWCTATSRIVFNVFVGIMTLVIIDSIAKILLQFLNIFEYLGFKLQKFYTAQQKLDLTPRCFWRITETRCPWHERIFTIILSWKENGRFGRLICSFLTSGVKTSLID